MKRFLFSTLLSFVFLLNIPQKIGAQEAIRITGGNVKLELNAPNSGVYQSQMNLTSAAFQISVMSNIEASGYPNVGTYHRRLETIDQSRTFSEIMRGGGIINNTAVNQLFVYNINERTTLTFHCENFIIPYRLIYRKKISFQTPCKMTGNLKIFDSPTNTQTTLLSAPIYGDGYAQLNFEASNSFVLPIGQSKYLLRSVNYVFINPSSIAEP